MKIALSIFASCLFATTTWAQNCGGETIQKDIDFERIAGDWSQVYFSPGSAYDHALCVESRIHNVSMETSTLAMMSKALTASYGKRRPETHIIQSTASWSDDGDFGINIKDRMATDYENYLVFFSCDSGKPFLDVRVRKGKLLHLRKLREVAEVADRIGANLFDLSERENPDCSQY